MPRPGGSKSPVNAGGSFSFTVTPSNGYTRGNGFSVKANGTTLTSNNGVYTISNINANQTVSVSGIVKSQNTGGGTLPAAPAITTTTLAAATMGKEYRQQITATGGTPITWSYSGTLPDGMTLAANTGILSGTPTQEGSFRFAVKATNSTGFSTRQMTLVVAGSEYTVTKGANSEWTQGGDKGIEFSGSGKGTFTVKVDGAAVAAREIHRLRGRLHRHAQAGISRHARRWLPHRDARLRRRQREGQVHHQGEG